MFSPNSFFVVSIYHLTKPTNPKLAPMRVMLTALFKHRQHPYMAGKTLGSIWPLRIGTSEDVFN